MKKRDSGCSSLYLLALVSLMTLRNVWAAPEPLSGLLYAENSVEDSDNLLLFQRLRQVAALKEEISEEERELTQAELDLQDMIEAKIKNQRILRPLQSDEAEMLPRPEAVVHHAPVLHSVKRPSYMTLCHFKICNMGRKRQS